MRDITLFSEQRNELWQGIEGVGIEILNRIVEKKSKEAVHRILSQSDK